MKTENQDKILYKGDWYFSISKEFCFNTNLSRDARFLLIILKSFTNDKNKEVFPSRDFLAKILGCSNRSLTRYIKELESFGYITVKRLKRNLGSGTFESNIYEITEKTNRVPKTTHGKNTECQKTAYGNSTTNNNQYINKGINKNWSDKS